MDGESSAVGETRAQPRPHPGQPLIRVVDDDEGILSALARTLASAGWDVETYASGQAFLEAYDAARPGCVLLDLRMPGMSGLRVQQKLAERGCRASIVFMTGHADVPAAVKAIKCGGLDCLQKPFAEEQLLDTVERAVEGDVEARRRAARRAELEARLALLTARERDVLRLLLAGMLNKQIAAELGISQRTVEVHRHHLMRKMQAGSVVHLLKMTLEVAAEGERRPLYA